jgi:putative ABC transport system permease protein
MHDWRDEIRRRIAHLRLDPTREREIVDELSQHLSDRHDELTRQGRAPADAVRATLAELDETDRLAKALGTAGQAPYRPAPQLGAGKQGAWTTLWQDLRYAIRSLRTSPGFTIIAALTLALGIGANTAIFSVVDAVILEPLPYRDADRVIVFFGTAPQKGLPEVDLTEELMTMYPQRSRTLELVAAHDRRGFTLTGTGDPERLEGGVVSADFFHVLGATPILGRAFATGDDVEGANRVVLGHGLWQRRFGSDSSIIGRSITLDGAPFIVIGVMAPGVVFAEHSELWTTVRLSPTRNSCWCWSAIGRLKPGFTALDAQRDLERITDEFRLERKDPDAKKGGSHFVTMPIARRIQGDVRTPLLVLLGAVGVLLLIACANIANVALARAGARSREIAVRCCLGASPRRIAAQLFTESLLLSVVGAGIGLLLGYWGVRAIPSVLTAQLPRVAQAHLDLRVLAFTFGITLLTGVLVGLTPALRASRATFTEALSDGARGGTSRGSRRMSDGFVISQFALSLMLLVGAGLLLRSFQHIMAVDPGFRADEALATRVALPYPRYGSDTVVRSFYDRLVPSVAALPGVRAVGLTSRVPLSRGNPQNNLFVEGHEPKPGEQAIVANVRAVTPDYFTAIGTPVLRGRAFTTADNQNSPLVGVVNEAVVHRYLENEDPIGKRFRYNQEPDSPWITIVGVVRNVKHSSLDEDQSLQVYYPFEQGPQWVMYMVVRSSVARASLVSAIRAQVAVLDPSVPLYDTHSMQDALDQSLGTRRLTNLLLTAFALISLLLASIGIYGVMALNLGSRRREFGVRLALGAKPGDVLSLVLGQGMRLIVTGTVIGLIGAFWATKLLNRLLFNVSRLDVPTFVAVSVTLVGVAAAACLIPARRATRADPVSALRE